MRRDDDVKALQEMVHRMREKLEQNEHKGHWQDYSVAYLVVRLREECTELETAILGGAAPEEVWREAADVANFAMFIARVYEMGHQGS